MVKGDQYLYSGDWWSLGVTLVELLTGKKPFKKKFQKYKNTEDKVKICSAGQPEDPIEEKNIEAKLGGAKEVYHLHQSHAISTNLSPSPLTSPSPLLDGLLSLLMARVPCFPYLP